MSNQNEQQIDPRILIQLLQEENAALRMQLMVLRAKEIQDAQGRSESPEEGQ